MAEQSEPKELNKYQLPTNGDVIECVLSRTKKKGSAQVLVEVKGTLAAKLFEIWNTADCCPITKRVIKKRYDDLYKEYRLLKSRNKHHECLLTIFPLSRCLGS